MTGHHLYLICGRIDEQTDLITNMKKIHRYRLLLIADPIISTSLMDIQLYAATKCNNTFKSIQASEFVRISGLSDKTLACNS